jgi:hypothetical protein
MLSTIQKLLLAFITLIIGLVLVGQVATVGQGVTSTKSITGETQALATNGTDLNTTGMTGATYTIVNYPTSWKVLDCPITSFSIKNSSGSALVADTDYTFTASSGQFVLLRTDLTKATLYPSNVSYQSYVYCGDDYLDVSWGRTVLNLTPGFFALALLIFSVGMFYSLARDAGII